MSAPDCHFSCPRHSEYLLASSSRDKTARIWSSGQGRVIHSVRVPQQFKGGKGRSDAPPAWISLAWPHANTLLTSGAGGYVDVSLPKSNLEK